MNLGTLARNPRAGPAVLPSGAKGGLSDVRGQVRRSGPRLSVLWKKEPGALFAPGERGPLRLLQRGDPAALRAAGDRSGERARRPPPRVGPPRAGRLLGPLVRPLPPG